MLLNVIQQCANNTEGVVRSNINKGTEKSELKKEQEIEWIFQKSRWEEIAAELNFIHF